MNIYFTGTEIRTLKVLLTKEFSSLSFRLGITGGRLNSNFLPSSQVPTLTSPVVWSSTTSKVKPLRTLPSKIMGPVMVLSRMSNWFSRGNWLIRRLNVFLWFYRSHEVQESGTIGLHIVMTFRAVQLLWLIGQLFCGLCDDPHRIVG